MSSGGGSGKTQSRREGQGRGREALQCRNTNTNKKNKKGKGDEALHTGQAKLGRQEQREGRLLFLRVPDEEQVHAVGVREGEGATGRQGGRFNGRHTLYQQEHGDERTRQES